MESWKKFLADNRAEGKVNPRIVCKDGFSISVQFGDRIPLNQEQKLILKDTNLWS